ncbi:MAG TPA: type II toxin-antitoxin system HicB family antitoxin [Tepidisphaeraceae bacterium]|jgi:antitoxin HicB|nr:type II toxin-antitoxin system HicB family antitoxin [Tepidisphaeraceae bacterium]
MRLKKPEVEMTSPRYTVIIQWSDEDQAYVVSLPEWGRGCKTHGATYEEAAKNAREVLEMLTDTRDQQAQGPLPEPKLFHYPGADVVDLPNQTKALNKRAG